MNTSLKEIARKKENTLNNINNEQINKCNSILSRKGYIIRKNSLSIKQIKKIRKDLTVKPIVNTNFGPPPSSFTIYMENKNKFYLPRFYGLEMFGKPDKNKIESEIKNINLKFNGHLRKKQIPVVNKFLESTKNGAGGLICLSCGFGKCFKINTAIMMYNGDIKMVQKIQVNDLLMGDDSKPRKVLSLARGIEEMYTIKQRNGDNYTVNKSHILSLKLTEQKKIIGKEMNENDILEISVSNYLQLSQNEKNCLKGYKTSLEFDDKSVSICPYILGKWLGNCNSNTNIDTNNDFYLILEEYKLLYKKYIPHEFKCNSREKRLNLLAGLIDTGGVFENNIYTFIFKSERLINDIIYLVRSLGILCSKKVYYLNNTYEVQIFGNNLKFVPITCIDKKYCISNLIGNDLTTDISIEFAGIDVYYGFEIDGNRRFLLEDTTVTHNTIIALNIISQLNKKTLIVVHKEFLLNQWIERINEFLPEAKVGIIQQNKVETEDKDIVIGMLQSISMKDYPEDTFNQFGFVAIDECHHLGAEVFSRALPKITAPYMLGLSATPDRQDGLRFVFEWYLGKMIYCIKEREPDTVGVKIIEFYCNDPLYCKEELNFQGRINNPKMITKICDYEKRSEVIIDEIKQLAKEKRKVLILSDRRNHLTYLKNIIDKKEICSTGYYVGGSKKEVLKESESKDVILGTYSMASEGMDIPLLNTIILASPKTNVEQSIGRIFRQKKDERTHDPLIIDIIDQIPIFKRQSLHRKRLYKKNKYTIFKKIIKDGEEDQNINKNGTNVLQQMTEVKFSQCLL